MEEERLVTSTMLDAEDEIENVLRPKSMEGYVGQEKIKDNLAVSMAAAKMRSDALDHVLLYGPAGLGKTTLAHIIATEMNAQIKITSGPAIERAADLAAIITNLNENDVLFIDEIHRLNHNVEEMLYSAMEDFFLDIITGKGPSASTLRVALPKFTLVGATTKAGMLSSPLRDRFGLIFRLQNYSVEELAEIITRSANMLGTAIDKDAAIEGAKRSRGTPRIANRLLRRMRDFATVKNHKSITLEDAIRTLDMMEIDDMGLDAVDIKLLTAMATKFKGMPCGLDTLAATINEDANTIEEVYDPYLLQLGFVQRTPRGRVLLEGGYRHIGLTPPASILKDENNGND